jgi:glycerol-3-phosphate cytidylyltransferase
MKGFVAGAFDLLHAGHIHLLKEAKQYCDYLVVGLHADPSIERPEKNKPVESILERMIKLRGCEYVNDIFVYETEQDLSNLIKYLNPDVRFLGSDYVDGNLEITDPTAVEIKYIDSLPIHTSQIRKRL